MGYTNAAATYRQNAILTASPGKIVKLLYDGAVKNMERCRIGLADPATSRGASVGESLGKALAIVGELRSSLNHEVGGEVTRNLDSLYEFTLHQLGQANLQRRPEPIEDGLRVMRTLKEAWDVVIPG